jgi:hypothetical protein
MSNLSSALVVPDSLLAKEATDLLREHLHGFIAASPVPNSESQSEAARWECRCPHVNKLSDVHARSRTSRLFCHRSQNQIQTTVIDTLKSARRDKLNKVTIRRQTYYQRYACDVRS